MVVESGVFFFEQPHPKRSINYIYIIVGILRVHAVSIWFAFDFAFNFKNGEPAKFLISYKFLRNESAEMYRQYMAQNKGANYPDYVFKLQ